MLLKLWYVCLSVRPTQWSKVWGRSFVWPVVDREIVQETIVTTVIILAGPCVDANGQEMKPFTFKYKLYIYISCQKFAIMCAIYLFIHSFIYLFQLSLQSSASHDPSKNYYSNMQIWCSRSISYSYLFFGVIFFGTVTLPFKTVSEWVSKLFIYLFRHYYFYSARIN